MAKTTPLYDWHKLHNGRIVDFAGWEMPVQYSSIIDEHHAVRRDAGIFDVSHMGRLEFPGEDAMDLLQRSTVNDVNLLANNRIQYSLVCNDLGGVIDDVLVYRIHADRWAMVCNASNREAVLARLRELNTRNARIDDATTETAMLAIQGPRAAEVACAVIHPKASQLHYYEFLDFLHLGSPSRLSRTGYTGEDGYEWILPAGQAQAAWQRIIDEGVKPCGLGARDTLRLEAAMPLYGHELSINTDPFSAGLGSFVKLDKSEFPGKEALARISTSPPLKRIGLELEGKRPARQGSIVLQGEKKIGEVTSGTFSPTLEKPVAMALVERGAELNALPIQVDIRGTVVPAKMVKLPFYRRKKTVNN